MKIRNIIFATVLLLAMTFPEVYASGHFATNYTNASLTGVYGYSGQGWILGPTNPNSNTTNVPLDNAGLMWFDGVGTFEFHDTVNLGGSIIQRGTADNPIVGTYTVNPDGTGTMTWSSNGSNHTRAFAIVAGGTELEMAGTEGLSTGAGFAKKQ